MADSIKINESDFNTAESKIQSNIDAIAAEYMAIDAASASLSSLWNGKGASSYNTGINYTLYDLSERLKELSQLLSDVRTARQDFVAKDQEISKSYSGGSGGGTR